MTTTFNDVEVGQRFFDPYCGEDFVKVCGNAASLLRGDVQDCNSLVTFESDESIEIGED